MAEVFISYSNQDKHIAVKLANELKARGFTVWWDHEILSGESFRALIDQELNSALAVVVIWTESSILSPWVQAEADHAAAQAKLLPLIVPGLDPIRIPKPHNILRTDNITDIQRIVLSLQRFVTRSTVGKNTIIRRRPSGFRGNIRLTYHDGRCI